MFTTFRQKSVNNSSTNIVLYDGVFDNEKLFLLDQITVSTFKRRVKFRSFLAPQKFEGKSIIY